MVGVNFFVGVVASREAVQSVRPTAMDDAVAVASGALDLEAQQRPSDGDKSTNANAAGAPAEEKADSEEAPEVVVVDEVKGPPESQPDHQALDGAGDVTCLEDKALCFDDDATAGQWIAAEPNTPSLDEDDDDVVSCPKLAAAAASPATPAATRKRPVPPSVVLPATGAAGSRPSPSPAGKKAPCIICLKVFPQMPKHSRYCYWHKEAVESCRKQAADTSAEALAAFKAKEADVETLHFRKLIMDFVQACPGMGRGKPRARYSFASLIESWRAATSITRQTKKRLMDYIDFTVYHMTRRLMTQDKSDKLWYEMVENPRVKRISVA